jgi:hypothetical protein
MRSAAMAHLLCQARPPRRGGSGSGRSRYQYDTPITWLRKAIRQQDSVLRVIAGGVRDVLQSGPEQGLRDRHHLGT